MQCVILFYVLFEVFLKILFVVVRQVDNYLIVIMYNAIRHLNHFKLRAHKVMGLAQGSGDICAVDPSQATR